MIKIRNSRKFSDAKRPTSFTRVRELKVKRNPKGDDDKKNKNEEEMVDGKKCRKEQR